MNRLSDQVLLRDYAEHQSESAFSEIVRRYVDLIHSAALRMLGDADAARDVTQGVFVLLAQNVSNLTNRPTIAGWLHCTAKNLAAKAVRTDIRRRAREQEAAKMNEILPSNQDDNWEKVAPHLDDALDDLSESERDAILLRYFKNHDLRTVGGILGISDDAAQKRVSRAVERLREFFAKRGVTVGAGGLVVVVSANAVQAAPVGLALAISTAAALTGTTLATTASVTATKAIAMTALQKTLISAILVAGVGTGMFEAHQASVVHNQNQVLQQQRTIQDERIQELQRERDNFARQFARRRESQSSSDGTNGELLRLLAEVTRLRNEKQQMATVGSQTNETANTLMSEGVKWLPQWKDVGQTTPEAALETYLWALANNQSERIRQLILLERDEQGNVNVEPSAIFSRREARADGDKWRGLKYGGIRVHRGFSDPGQNLERANFEIEWMPFDAKNMKIIPIDPANPPAWNPSDSETFNLVKVDDEWKVLRPNTLRLTFDDEDSEEMAKMMLKMDPETLEQLKADPKLPAQTLQAYERLKAQGGQ